MNKKISDNIEEFKLLFESGKTHNELSTIYSCDKANITYWLNKIYDNKDHYLTHDGRLKNKAASRQWWIDKKL